MSGFIDEGLLTGNGISELEESPVVGRFDTVHLCAIPYRIFQDLPHHHLAHSYPANIIPSPIGPTTARYEPILFQSQRGDRQQEAGIVGVCGECFP